MFLDLLIRKLEVNIISLDEFNFAIPLQGFPRGQLGSSRSSLLPLPCLRCGLSAATGHVAIYPVAPQFGHIKRATNSSNWPLPTTF